MNEDQRSLFLSSSSHFPPPQGVKLSYGTSGFRADASILQSTVYRVGILAALRALKTQSVIGLMITASHNKVSDNGVKVADPSGGMLSQDWEPFADTLANAHDPQHLVELIAEFVQKENITLDGTKPVEILLARDTRPSGEFLLEAAKQGIGSIIGAVALDMGILTTPQLHWMVRARNGGMKASETDYFKQLSSSFRCLVDLSPSGTHANNVDDKLVVDGANGVGGEKLEILKTMLNGLAIEVRNSGKEGGVLNEGVGADYVQKEKVVPFSFGSQDVGLRCASLDGDADRLVYFIVPSTTYANGASTDYLKQLGLEVTFTPTGVKYLHEKAAEYDIGIYFEANGHGTILFSEQFLCWLKARTTELSDVAKGSEQHKAALRLLAVSELINQAAGDALSGVFFVEAILKHMGWSIERWNEIYEDLPSRQLKVKVVDRSAVVTANAETVAVTPPGIQEAINAETAKHPRGRCFIRPSGTEDVIRVYAEASVQDAADNLAQSVAKLVDQFLGFGSS
ncbi:phosphoacetylglucosamine mutase isoform X1 [Prunus yedoensis var. nudiflora]|uniref:Phosphoacetylglucosamine mutase n=1 Tax=Prunus yedoensis var. nudiflora TaxID=2094558 RepID=A0A314Z8F4_PRUYE|nr:phosphoacetylglucosamine mutase isoform X1 [Prunus yedoensis var. nudiflora]